LSALEEELGLADGAAPGSHLLETGAVVTFSGIVRRTEHDRSIDHLAYECYESMAVHQLEALISESRTRWPLGRVGILHRIGRVPVGESSVLIVVATSHRAEAFEAARFLIDELKRTVPIWKGTA
jgi:molybdopterin synthase catalytic subunit